MVLFGSFKHSLNLKGQLSSYLYILVAVLVSEALLYSVDVDAYTGFLYGQVPFLLQLLHCPDREPMQVG